jgi:DMSO/TMAO reductase YedYZ heme-binding membrane subunit
MTRVRPYAWIVFVLFAVLATLFGVFPGSWFDEPLDADAALLTSTYAAVAVVLTVGIASTALRRGERWAWLVLWVWPAFFVVHGIAFFPVDLVFAALGAGALLVAPPSSAPAAPGSRTAA